MLGLMFLIAIATPVEGEPDYRAARASYDAFEFEDARLLFERLGQRSATPTPEKARLRLWVGMCHAEEGALEAAAAEFEAAAMLDVDVEALPVMSPKARRMLEEARERARRRAPPDRPAPLPDPEAETSVVGDVAPAGPAPPRPLLVGGGAALGIAGVATLGAAIAGLAATAAAADAATQPRAADAAARHADAQQLALGANIGFVIAGAGAALGVGLVVAGLVDDG